MVSLMDDKEALDLAVEALSDESVRERLGGPNCSSAVNTLTDLKAWLKDR